jgi:hypothetical protein
MEQLLIVEDDVELCELLAERFKRDGSRSKPFTTECEDWNGRFLANSSSSLWT